ncbi:iron-sulfur cluster assembly scaffold protein [Tistrella bauzanensis]|uniref:Iron-sulfur cluster assembly scaffold protein n=1 Tax=Tistrella bauzanensis TaxID=657419 RepID=A0ABQ1IIF3_9PROT|nr:SUF system NifU family Fe-S cluster assembly protein [Tistrella bauzanensis]GGB39524.1 iron-sulfur cluster assembly scaffold protein [Tistrella bauzanensis]
MPADAAALDDDLRLLYQQVILDHNRNPHHAGRLDPADATAHGHNPLCGDEVTVDLRMDGDRVAAIAFKGRGCAISTASASMMTDAVLGRSRDEIASLFTRFRDLVTGTDPRALDDPEVEAVLGVLAALGGVREFPSRVKCATLPWHTLARALGGGGGGVSTE